MNNKKYTSGSAIVWVIVIIVIVLAIGGYLYYLKNNQVPPTLIMNSAPTSQSVDTQASPTGTTNTSVPDQGSLTTNNPVNTTVPNSFNFSCNQIVPFDSLKKSFPSSTFSPGAAEHKKVPLMCVYTSQFAYPPVYSSGLDVYTSSHYNELSNISQYGASCASSDVGSKSVFCPATNYAPALILFLTSNNKYAVTVNLGSTGGTVSNTQQILEQMAKEVDSRLSPY